MDALIINRNDKDSLKVILDKDKDMFIFTGNSLPENATAFFTPIHEWLSEYKTKANAESIVHIHLNYYNTTSSKHLLKIFFQFKDILAKGNDVIVKWYGAESADYLDEAKIYQNLVNIPFEYIEKVPDFSKFFNS